VLRCTLAELRDHVGAELGSTQWRAISQDEVNVFGKITDDEQWIHTDPDRAAEGPFGATIAHGYYTLSLSSSMVMQLLEVTDADSIINYGLNRVRFPSAVPVGSRVRGTATVAAVEDVKGGAQAIVELTIDVEGASRPSCVAEMVIRYLH